MLALSLVYFGNVACLYGVGFWLPTIVKGFGVSIAATGWISAIPYVVGFLGMVWWGMRSDRMGERTMHLAISLALAAIGIGASALLTDPTTKMIALTVGSFGVYASLPIFWTLPTAFLAGAAVAPGIAAINSIGNLSGYFGPFVIGWIKDATGSFAWGLATIAACAVVALVITLALGHDPHLERAPEAADDRRRTHADTTRLRRLRPGGGGGANAEGKEHDASSSPALSARPAASWRQESRRNPLRPRA